MKNFLLAIFLYCSLFSIAQKSSKVDSPTPTQNGVQQKLKDESCVFRTIYSGVQLMSLFPFNQTASIRLISFDPLKEEERGVIHKFFHVDSLRNYYFDSIKIDTDNWKEAVTLDTSRFRNLGNLMFNYAPFKASNVGIDTALQCYRPRNEIIFYNESDQIISVIEICFECQKMQFFPNSFRLNYNCTNKFELFKKFFLQNGIKYGTTQINQSN